MRVSNKKKKSPFFFLVLNIDTQQRLNGAERTDKMPLFFVLQTSGLRGIRNAENEEPQEHQTKVSRSLYLYLHLAASSTSPTTL